MGARAPSGPYRFRLPTEERKYHAQTTLDFGGRSHPWGDRAACASNGNVGRRTRLPGRGARGGTVSTTAPAGAMAATATPVAADVAKLLAEINASRGANAQTNSEDLGVQHHFGVPAQGTRTTLTIPVGQIGNNRDIKV